MDDAFPSEIEHANALVAGCEECARLAADIRLVSSATAQLPMVRRLRDFRITADDAQRLRGSWFDRLARRFAAPGLAFGRPLAGAALAIGLALAVVGSLPAGGTAGGAASDAAPQAANVSTTAEDALASNGGDFLGGVSSDKPTQGDTNVEAASLGPDKESMPAYAMSSAPTQPGPATAPEAGSGTPGDQRASDAPTLPPPGTFSVTEQASPPVDTGTGGQIGKSNTPPSAAPGAAVASSGVRESGSLDRPLVVAFGLALAILALGILLVIGAARRRFGDPLVR
jgi:hypothetical protein